MRVNYDHKPSVMEAVGDGTIRFRYDITQVTKPALRDDEQPITGWDCEELTVYPPISSNALIASAIAERWPSDCEQKLVNDYNCTILGLTEGDTANQAIDRYRRFLEERSKLKAKIEAACQAVGVE